MKTEAYICDKCGGIFREEEIQGFLPTVDMFDPSKSYPVTYQPDKTDFHFCLECYRVNVINPVENHTNRAKDEAGRNAYLKQVSYAFKNFIVAAKNKPKK